jgi:hypothetical protein
VRNAVDTQADVRIPLRCCFGAAIVSHRRRRQCPRELTIRRHRTQTTVHTATAKPIRLHLLAYLALADCRSGLLLELLAGLRRS